MCIIVFIRTTSVAGCRTMIEGGKSRSVVVGRKLVGRHVVGIVCQHQQGWLVRRIVVQRFVLAHGIRKVRWHVGEVMRGRDTLLLSVRHWHSAVSFYHFATKSSLTRLRAGLLLNAGTAYLPMYLLRILQIVKPVVVATEMFAPVTRLFVSAV
jgi:hypothetical protein